MNRRRRTPIFRVTESSPSWPIHRWFVSSLLLISMMATRSLARSTYSSRGHVARNTRTVLPRKWGAVTSAFISYPVQNGLLNNKHVRSFEGITVVRTYSDYILGDDEDIFEEVVEDVKHSSSLSDDDGQESSNNDHTNDSSKDNQDVPILRSKLKKELLQYRIDQAASIDKPAYNIFTNAALDGICASLPTNEDQLLEVKGIGPKKLEMYGDDIIDIVKKYVGDGGLLPECAAINGSKTVSRPEPISIESLTPEQRKAAEMALNGKSVFISGAAGTGKSHVSKFIIQSLQEAEKKCSPTAPTGVAAINVGGSTLHSFFGIGLGVGSVSSLVRKIKKKNAVLQRINETDALLIDEVSMLSCDLLETLDEVARQVRKRNEPMGGMQIIAVGDFFQLPPIMKQEELVEDSIDKQRLYCFDSPVWAELGLTENTVQLTEVQRQEHGSKFEMFLSMVRNGNVPPNVLRDFNRKCLISHDNPLPDDGIIPTRIYTHNLDVDSMNESRLAHLDGDLVTCEAIDEWREKMPVGTPASVKKNMKASIAGELSDIIRLKVGAQVMLTRNKDLENGFRSLVNGSRGVVESFKDELPIVRFDNGRVEKVTRVEAIRYNPDGGIGVLVRKQLPLKLAWATTVHKSQGSTLSRAILDVSKVRC
eukprot:CCRYP_018295-RB/>CCRYP_018295-RB protein AED:0.02 eAED:0.02 QI:116/1/1/1/1/1/2/226/648